MFICSGGDQDEFEMDPDAVKSHQLAADMLRLNEHSVQLRNALENEIKGLERNMCPCIRSVSVCL